MKVRRLLALDVIELLGVVGLSSILSILVSALLNWLSEERRFKRDQNIAYLTQKIDRFYSPMMFHFENMRSWSDAWSRESGYSYSGKTLAGKLEDMKDLMRSGLRFASPDVRTLWYKWQPFAVAAVERRRRRNLYPWFSEEGFQIRSKELHAAVRSECERLTQEYKRLLKKRRLLPLVER
jgi:hypothetical protein